MLHVSATARRYTKDSAIFAEPTGRRWNGFVVLVGSMLATVCFLSVILGISAFSTPELSLKNKLTEYQTDVVVRQMPVQNTELAIVNQSIPSAETPMSLVEIKALVDVAAQEFASAVAPAPVPAIKMAPEKMKEPRQGLAQSPDQATKKAPARSVNSPSITWLDTPPKRAFTTIGNTTGEEPSPTFFHSRSVTTL